MKVGEMLEILKHVDPMLDLTTPEGETVLGIFTGPSADHEIVAMIEFD